MGDYTERKVTCRLFLSIYAGRQSPFPFEKGYSCFLCSSFMNPGQMQLPGIFQRSVKPRPRCKPGGDQIRFLHKGVFYQLVIKSKSKRRPAGV